jgi:hypothetical protein
MTMTLDRAVPADDEAIRSLMRRQPMPGRIGLACEREPDFSLGCTVTGDRYEIVVAREADAIVGVACRSVRSVFINGREQRIGYLGQLRVDERFRGRWLVSRGFSLLSEIDRADPVPAYLVSIVDGNDEAAGVLVRRRRRSFPIFHEVSNYRTLALRLWRAKASVPGDEEIIAASAEHIPGLVRFLRTEGARRQLFPVWSEHALNHLAAFGLRIDDIRIARRDARIVGAIGLWDQSAYKQTVVRAYSGWMKAAAWLGAMVVPRIGTHLRSAYAALVCVANDDAAVFRRLLRDVYNLAIARGFEYLLLGLDARDPLLAVAREYRHFQYPSVLYLGSWPQRGDLHEQLDHRPTYVDIATL